ncbi:hypothetical protein [Spirosoma fluviale]|uniref:PKD domain-containing protein n=1 Tax=Spirosoma fluviale TaxID=1597977 RepID=A0A286GQJ4_9BACT|nr:hypothetical protein [Spirosoma fluviale]SOD97831.1 hypothetical protein SAMN06269250_5936 [Spirosoma fluviale]
MITENGQPGKVEAFAFLEVCCRKVSEAYGKPDRDRWTNSDYVSLSHILYRQTHVRISPNTLKRIFGKIKTDVRYYPQKATRDALSVYIGYPDWDHFVNIQEWEARQTLRPPTEFIRQENLPEPPVYNRPASSTPQKSTDRHWLRPILASGGILLLITGLLFVWQHRNGQESARLICRNPLGENPHSAVFQLKRPVSNADQSGNYTILFGDGKRENLNANDSLYTHYYERPGRYFAILQQNGVNVDTATIYLRTTAWTVTANMMHDSSRVYPIEIKDLFTGGQRSVNTQEAARAGIDTNRTFFMEFINSHPTPINGDNFELTTHVTSSPDRAGVRCSQVGIMVWGESSQHAFEVMKSGCAHWMQLQNSEIQKNGQRDDLTFLAADLRAGGMLTLKVIDRHAAIFINNRRVYETTYTKPLKTIYGVKIRFSGIGTVHSFTLKDLKTGALFDGNF